MVAVPRNRDILTKGKRYSQQQAKKHGVSEVIFDKDARTEYLTGFHKRKLQRQKKAQEFHREQERLARIEERKQIKEERRRDVENQIKSYKETIKRTAVGNSDDDEDEAGNCERNGENNNDTNVDGEWMGFGESEGSSGNEDGDGNGVNLSTDSFTRENGSTTLDGRPCRPAIKGINQQQVYKVDHTHELANSNALVDEETTVTVQSLENPSSVAPSYIDLEAIAKANNVNLDASDKVLEQSINRAKNYAVLCGVAKPSAADKFKKKKKKFRYLTKGERRENASKEKAKKRKRV